MVERRTARLAEGGIAFVLDCEVGRDVTLEALRARHDAVLVATGVYAARSLERGAGVVPALDYLIASNRTGLGDAVTAFADGRLDARGKRVLVLGGGDTAMDCLRTAVRQGASEVTCLYRRDRANMPGSAREVAHAEEEGVRFEWLTAPLATVADGSVEVRRMRLGAPDRGGRRAPEPVDGAAELLRADLVIGALGFDAEDLPELWEAPDLSRSPHGALRIDRKSFETTLPGVFAAGDIVRGASLVVWAVRDGLDAAEAMDAWLSARAPASALVAAE